MQYLGKRMFSPTSHYYYEKKTGVVLKVSENTHQVFRDPKRVRMFLDLFSRKEV